MTMGLAIITMVLIGVMGAGLLTFVSTDLTTVVEVNQGQKALELADAGVRAAQRQILTDSDPDAHYDGGLDDLRWSYCYQGTGGAPSGCTSATPTATGSPGMRLNMGADYVSVTILKTTATAPTFKVISEGRVGQARRKVEAVFESGGAVSAPRAYLTRGNLTLTGSANPQGASFFALGDVTITGSFALGPSKDSYFGKWAETTGAVPPSPNTTTGSYPNTYNRTPRGSDLIGIGARGSITESGGANAFEGTRSYDSTPVSSTTPRVVTSHDASPLPDNQEIVFPFNVPTAAEDKQTIETLKKRALALEALNPGTGYYIDSIPGNGVDDPGRSNGGITVNDWYPSSDFQTVRFYKFQTYNTTNLVSYADGTSIPDCTSTLPPPRGVIVVQNGDMVMAANKSFDGAVIVRAYDSLGNVLSPPTSSTDYTRGSFKGEGSACLRGYANSSGNMRASGTITAGAIPDLASTFGANGSMKMLSWRELYQ